MIRDPIFLDCEASSLHGAESYPVEIAWGSAEGDEGIETHLIDVYCYPPDWTDWDPSAQAVHGYSRAYLHRHGQAPGQVATAIHCALAQRIVYK